jgi:uncharacterized membrane protein YidH (DUF202 family)
MSCFQLDVDSPFLWLFVAALFLGASMGNFSKWIASRKNSRRRSRASLGALLSLSGVLLALLGALGFLELAEIEWRAAHLTVVLLAAGIGAAHVIVRRLWLVCIVLLMVLAGAVSVALQGLCCVKPGEELLTMRVLSAREEGLSVEISGGKTVSEERIGQVSGTEVLLQAVRYRSAGWFFFTGDTANYGSIALVDQVVNDGEGAASPGEINGSEGGAFIYREPLALQKRILNVLVHTGALRRRVEYASLARVRTLAAYRLRLNEDGLQWQRMLP